MLVYFETKRVGSLKTKKKKNTCTFKRIKKAFKMTCGAYPRKFVLDEMRMGELIPVDKNQISQIQYVFL